MTSGEELTAQLAGICGPEYVLTHPDALATYRSDGLWPTAPYSPPRRAGLALDHRC